MFKTLFTKLLVSIAALTALLLILLGSLAALIFRSHYIDEIKAELTAETNAISAIVVNEYLDGRYYAMAREKLYAISRQYGAAIRLVFKRNSPMDSDIIDAEYEERWRGEAELDVTALTDELMEEPGIYSYQFDMLRDVSGIRSMTVTRLLLSSDGRRDGVILLYYDMTPVYETLNALYLDILVLVSAAFLIALPIAFIISKRMTKPLASIKGTVTAFSRGDYESRIAVQGRDEVAQLAVSFNHMADEIAGTEKQRREFVANVSHELRSPLTSLHGFIEAMQDGVIPLEEHEKYLPVLRDETERMTKLVNDLLDISRIESGQSELELMEFNINELIANTLLTFEARIMEKAPEVRIDFAQEHCFVLADQGRIGQVLRNLIDNAIRYVPEQGGILELGTRVDKQCIIISVANNGESIPGEAIGHIFDRFYKVERARTRTKHGGTGLGLSIAKLIVNEHGGDIWVQSDERRTVFSFSLKRASGRRA